MVRNFFRKLTIIAAHMCLICPTARPGHKSNHEKPMATIATILHHRHHKCRKSPHKSKCRIPCYREVSDMSLYKQTVIIAEDSDTFDDISSSGHYPNSVFPCTVTCHLLRDNTVNGIPFRFSKSGKELMNV